MIRSLALARAAVCLSACSALESDATFEVRDAGRLSQVDCIAVLPVARYPAALAGNEDALSAFDAALEAELMRRGYRVVPVEVMASLLGDEARARGIDLRPGHAAPVELEALYADACAALHEVHGAQALLHPSLEWREAKISGVRAVWDGAFQSIEYRSVGEEAGEYPNAIRGSVTALSLRVQVEGPAREVFYEGYGGLHVQTRIDRFLNPVDVPAREMLGDPERTKAAVARALAGLAGTPGQ